MKESLTLHLTLLPEKDVTLNKEPHTTAVSSEVVSKLNAMQASILGVFLALQGILTSESLLKFPEDS